VPDRRWEGGMQRRAIGGTLAKTFAAHLCMYCGKEVASR